MHPYPREGLGREEHRERLRMWTAMLDPEEFAEYKEVLKGERVALLERKGLRNALRLVSFKKLYEWYVDRAPLGSGQYIG